MNSEAKKWGGRLAAPIGWVLLIALGIRIYAALTTHIVNPDGILYIHQARALFYHQWQEITACGMHYFSILPPLIAGAFALCRDWEAAGRIVSVLFGFGALIPLYFIVRRFFTESVAALVLLIFALIPALAGRSADIIRDPVYWFFLASGLLLFTRHLDAPHTGRLGLNLPLAAVLMLIAGWARIEAVVFILLSAGYLLVFQKNRRVRDTLSFLSPMIVIAAAGLITLALLEGNWAKLLRLDKIARELLELESNYQGVRAGVQELAQGQSGALRQFLRQAGDFVWIVPFGPLLDSLFEKFFYPYVLIFFAGFAGLRARLENDLRARYFLLLCAGAFLMLYLHLLNTWMMFDRFLANLILPAVVVVGYGCENILRFFRKRTAFRPGALMIVFAIVVLAFGLGKNLRPRYAEKIVFREIARQIVQDKTLGRLARIAAAPSNAYEWVFFYANQDVAGAPCSRANRAEIMEDYARFVAYLKAEEVRYVLWSAETPAQTRFDLLAMPLREDFDVISTWRYNRSESYTLLAVKAN